MKIGIVTTWFERGAAYVSRQFMDVLLKTDEVYIYARGGEKYAKDDPKWNLPNVHWGIWSEGHKRFVNSTYIDKKDFEKWLKTNGIEIVLFNEQQWFPPVLWCKDVGVRAVAYIDYYTEITIPFFDAYDALICNTKRHAFAFRKHKNCKYIKWGTDIQLYKPNNNTHEKITFFHSAGMSPERKGTDLLIRAFYQCPDRKKSQLLIHTQVPLNEIIADEVPLIRELESEGSLEIVEKTISAPGLYKEGDVYVYPSRLDGIGLTLMEAVASGMAIITVDNPPMNEFVEKEFGQVCKVDYLYSRIDGYYWPMCVADISSLTKILNNYITGKYDLGEMKKAARKYAEKELDFSKNCQDLHKILAETSLSPISEKTRSNIDSYFRLSLFKRLVIAAYPIAKFLLRK